MSQDVVEAVNLLAQGKRNYMCGEVLHAVSQLQQACRLLYDSTTVCFSLLHTCSVNYFCVVTCMCIVADVQFRVRSILQLCGRKIDANLNPYRTYINQ